MEPKIRRNRFPRLHNAPQRVVDQIHIHKLISTYECKPQELKETVERLTDQIAENWADYMM